MNKLLLTFLSISISLNLSSQQFCDDFESYVSGDPIAQTSPNWNSWAELMNGVSAPFTD